METKKRLIIRGRSSKELKNVIARYQQIVEIKSLSIRNLKKTISKLRDNTEVKQLKNTISRKETEITKLTKQSADKSCKIQEVLSRKARGYTKTVKVPLSAEAKRIEKIANKGASQTAINNLEYVTRTAIFIKKNKITMDFFSLITRADILGNVQSTSLGVSYKILNRLVDLGYLTPSNELKGAKKYWFVSLKGKELIKQYKDYLAHGKSILTK